MAVSTVNTFGNATLGVLGIRGYARKTGESTWIDLGIIKNWEPTDETETLDIDGARSGLTQIYESLPISASLGYTFDSENPNDQHILELWNVAAMAAAVGADMGHVSPLSFQSTTVEMLWVRENAQATKPSQILYHPSASIRRAGQSGTPGEEASGLSFEVTVTADETYTIPAGINAGEPVAQYGYLWVVPTAKLDDATTLASAVQGS